MNKLSLQDKIDMFSSQDKKKVIALNGQSSNVITTEKKVLSPFE